jgi:hypothetical protein
LDAAHFAIFVSAGSLAIAACAFALQLRRYFDEGVRLSVNIMVGARLVGGLADLNKYLSVTVMNRGSAPTTITHMVLYNYPSRLARHVPNWLYRRIKRFHAQTYVVNTIGSPGPIPYLLEPGRMWNGRATQTSDLDKMIEDGRLYVGIICTHSNKTLFKRVRREWKPPSDAKTV